MLLGRGADIEKALLENMLLAKIPSLLYCRLVKVLAELESFALESLKSELEKTGFPKKKEYEIDTIVKMLLHKGIIKRKTLKEYVIKHSKDETINVINRLEKLVQEHIIIAEKPSF